MANNTNSAENCENNSVAMEVETSISSELQNLHLDQKPKSRSKLPKPKSAKKRDSNAVKRKSMACAGIKKKSPQISYTPNRAYIRFMHAYCAKHGKRLIGPDMVLKAARAWCHLSLAKRQQYNDPRMLR
ncbi:uncharacterized protein LOC6584302 [Drosophila mojavensis]|uniref:Uncharacterized protein n=1 Tax=Drosophila mojavensis TaxID=7230 RepID=B4L3Z7_DROMO|nr:uncharacterized protein LOC6584302 [Drosophila mojavensis]EDW07275.2 uncharacterized protein Dmoj_GI14957 [Drosophila mojavensis]